MQAAPQAVGQQASVKIYNAVYSSVQVYECMVRGIAVMRRRADSFVNATQILKVAGVDKGRRTKILEKEILPGKHEIVQGGYGKYQGTWIPLERGRELALQYGIAHLLSPLFDFMPNSSAAAMTSLPSSFPTSQANMVNPRPLAPAASFPSMSNSQHGSFSSSSTTHHLGPAPIMPGSALRLLQHGRAQGLFTPSTTSLQSKPGTPTGTSSYYPGLLPGYSSSQPSPSNSTAPMAPGLKRTRTDSEIQLGSMANGGRSADNAPGTSHPRSRTPDVQMMGEMRPASAAPSDKYRADGEAYSKRAKTDPPLPLSQASTAAGTTYTPSQPLSRTHTATSIAQHNGASREDSSSSIATGSRAAVNGSSAYDRSIRLSNRAIPPSDLDRAAPLKNMKRSAVMNAICQDDNAALVLEIMTDAVTESPNQASMTGQEVDWNLIIDDMGHTPLHLAASLARIDTVKALVDAGADMHRGNYQGETPLIRSILSTHNYDDQSFERLVAYLHPSIRTIDTAKRSVLHHATLSAGIKNRAPYAKYYLEGVLSWIAEHEGGDFRSLVDLQDEHGDTALNVAARVGNRSLVRTLLDVGANRLLANKLGLRPGDFGVEPEELAAGPRAEDLLSSLRSPPSLPAQKSQDVIADLTSMIRKLSSDFATEIKSKQDALDVTGAHLRVATRELADQRRQITTWQARCGEYDQANQRIRNLEKAAAAEDKFDWTGRTVDVGGEKDKDGLKPNPAFAPRKGSVAVDDNDASEISSDEISEPPVPTENSLESLIRLRRMKIYQERMEQLLDARLKSLQGASAEKEFMCKKIVAMCTGIPIDRVEDILDNLVIAVESESQIIDIGRVSGFMQKVRDGLI